MEHLRDSDGSAVHRRFAKFHMSRCKGVSPLHDKLHSETSSVYATLRDAERSCQDAEDAATEALGVLDRAEEGVENAIRNLDAQAAQLDRTQPGLNAQRSIFPDGFGDVIKPEGRAQVGPLAPLRVRFNEFAGKGGMDNAISAYDTAEATFLAAIAASDTADTEVETRFAKELQARRAVREQLASSYGRLRDFYRSRPALAERFFLRERSRSAKRAKQPAPAPAAGNGVTPAPA